MTEQAKTSESVRRSSRAPLRIAIFFLLVLGVSSYILVPKYSRARAAENLNGCISNLKNLATALDMWGQDHEGALPSKLEDLTPDYLVSLPQCPAAEQSTYRMSVRPNVVDATSGEPEKYYLQCSGHHHARVAVPPEHPAFSSLDGLIDR